MSSYVLVKFLRDQLKSNTLRFTIYITISVRHYTRDVKTSAFQIAKNNHLDRLTDLRKSVFQVCLNVQ